MFHLSTDRLAGLDTMILKITSPAKVSTLIPHHDTYMPVVKLKKQKAHRETRPPLADKTASNNPAPRPPCPTSSTFLHALSTAGEVKLLFPNDPPSPRVPCPPNIPSFRPLPPLPSASTLQLPSFLNFSAQSFSSLAGPPPRRSAASLPASVLFRVSSSPIASSRHVVVCNTKNNKVSEGPQWIPAFHHPNSPYVPWSSPVRRRILPPPSPLLPSPVCFSSPRTRSGAVAPEPGGSSTFSQTQNKSGKERLYSSWKSFKKSMKKGVKTVVSHFGKSSKSLRAPCIGQDVLHTYDDTDIITTVVHNPTPNAMRSTLARARSRGSRDSLASFVSSDSRTLAAWLAERRASASCLAENTTEQVSVEDYELAGSWLDLRHYDGGCVCGVQDCDMHSAGGFPHAASEYPDGLRTAMRFDSVDLMSVTRPPPRAPAWRFPGLFSAPPHFHSLPQLPCQSSDVHSAQEAERERERCLMPRRSTSQSL